MNAPHHDFEPKTRDIDTDSESPIDEMRSRSPWLSWEYYLIGGIVVGAWLNAIRVWAALWKLHN